ncbi:MAG: hypothetical protein DIU60_013735 [Actinomycetes bacterium]|jgi:hypothetical protein|nr:MAG: hypothetical protein DIU60_01805 [Actinomycetota bacterium]
MSERTDGAAGIGAGLGPEPGRVAEALRELVAQADVHGELLPAPLREEVEAVLEEVEAGRGRGPETARRLAVVRAVAVPGTPFGPLGRAAEALAAALGITLP